LYRSTLKIINHLSYSDVCYIKNRVRSEFKKNATLTDRAAIDLEIKVLFYD
jgi:hypothetical protein